MGRFTGIFRVTTDKNSPVPGEPGSLIGLYENGVRVYRGNLMAACAAARRAVGIRKGEQET